MPPRRIPPVLIVISGPIASGKSSLARGVARELRREGVATAVVDLDQLYDMQTGALDGPKADSARWKAARHAAAALAESFAADGIAVVIVEGSFQSRPDRLLLTGSRRPRSDVLFVTLRVSYEEALRRAQSDPTRGVSRDPTFLRRHYERSSKLAIAPRGDLVIDTESCAEEEEIAAVVRAALALQR